jgi:thioester reductase-like protein
MSHNILLTGGSGYLGGTLLARWNEAQLPSYGKLFALVRS